MQLFDHLDDEFEEPLRHPVRFYAILIAIVISMPILTTYENYVYERDQEEFRKQEQVYDSTEFVRVTRLMDSLYAGWVATHDTSLRELVRVDKRPTYSDRGKLQKTGRMVCKERKENGNLVCEPEIKFVVTGSYVSGYTMDTVWTEGYNSRDEWEEEAWEYARKEAEATIELLPYTGHEKDFLENSMGVFSYIYILFYLAAFFILFFNLAPLTVRIFRSVFGSIRTLARKNSGTIRKDS